MLTTMETTATVLTKEHIKFIRTADKVCFRYVNGRCTMEVSNKIGAELALDCEFNYRGFDGGSDKKLPAKAFAMIHTPSFTQSWLTVVELLKAGDSVRLEWMANSNGYVQAASLHMDEMALVIKRGKQRLTFNLCLSVCPDNSARMFQF